MAPMRLSMEQLQQHEGHSSGWLCSKAPFYIPAGILSVCPLPPPHKVALSHFLNSSSISYITRPSPTQKHGMMRREMRFSAVACAQ